MSSTDEKIKFLERKLFDQSQSIAELTKNFDKLFSTNNNPKFSWRKTNLEDDITQNRGESFLRVYFFLPLFIYNLNLIYAIYFFYLLRI